MIESATAPTYKSEVFAFGQSRRFVLCMSISAFEPKRSLSSGLGLFRFDVGGLDDWPPARRLLLLVCAQRLGRLLLTRYQRDSLFRETLLHLGFGECLDEYAVELGDDILRRPLGDPNAVPHRGVKPGQPRLVDGWHLRENAEALFRGYGKSFDRAGPHLGIIVGRGLDHEIDLPADQILNYRRISPKIRGRRRKRSGHGKACSSQSKDQQRYRLIAATRSSGYMTGATTYEAPPTVMAH